jgi:hypothetical protein
MQGDFEREQPAWDAISELCFDHRASVDVARQNSPRTSLPMLTCPRWSISVSHRGVHRIDSDSAVIEECQFRAVRGKREVIIVPRDRVKA